MIQRVSWIWPNIHHISLETAAGAEEEDWKNGILEYWNAGQEK
jgi:hypothetical protein